LVGEAGNGRRVNEARYGANGTALRIKEAIKDKVFYKEYGEGSFAKEPSPLMIIRLLLRRYLI
jgi:hypothetical protein